MLLDLKFYLNILRKKLTDPLFVLAIILLSYWLMDSWYKIFIQQAPTRMLWYSSMGLLGTSIGLLKRNTFILSSMFCVLLFQEGIWNLSFFSNLLGLPDYFQAASYAFGKTFPKIGLFITLFHLWLLPSIAYGIYKIKKVSYQGWLGGYIFALIINYLPLFFPNKEDVNCVRGAIASCQIFFGAFYNIDPLIGIFGGVTYQLFLIYIPSNILLINVYSKWRAILNFFQSLSKINLSKTKMLDTFTATLIFIMTIFWLADTFEKVSIQHAISRIFWWSSMGLILITIGLYKRSSLILTGMFCSLFLIESLWTIGFLTYLFFGYQIPHLGFASTGFNPHYQWSSFVISWFHLLLIPGLIYGLLIVKKIHPLGWIIALVFHVLTLSLAHFFPDPSENINCSKVINLLCQNIYGLSSNRTFIQNLVISSVYQTVFLYLPLNLILMRIFKTKTTQIKRKKIIANQR